MFASAAHHPQLHQFHHQVNSPSHVPELHNLRFDSVFGAPGHGRETQSNLAIRNTFRKPPQYALPIQSPFLEPNRASPGGSWLPRPDVSEHMLRRKTPNGTLAAGYDGTQVEWMARPHASKHMLMPVLDTPRQLTKQPLPCGVRDGFSSAHASVPDTDIQYHTWEKATEVPRDGHGCDFAFGSDTGRGQWGPSNPLSPSLDSVLHQGPGPPHFYHQPGLQQVPTVLQPMWPPFVGPTASNSQGPYGPYWPNGSYEPYRPAALRDGRFHSQFANITINDPLETQPSAQDCATLSNSQNNVLQGGLSTRRQDQWKARDLDGQVASSYSFVQNNHTAQKQAIHYLSEGNSNAQTHPSFAEYRSRGIPIRYPKNTVQGSAWPSTPSSNLTTSPLTPENGQSVNNLQFKEKALVWSHRIYLNLLSYIQRSRKHNHNKHRSGERQSLQSTIVLKPPIPDFESDRDSGKNNNKDHRHDRNLVTADRDLKYPLQLSADPTNLLVNRRSAGSDDLKWSNSKIGNMYHEQYRNGGILPRQYQKQLQIQLSHPISAGYASIPLPSGPGTFNQTHQHSSPTADARAALEILARLSQESGWEWTDGILLGGCLAYGLGDYEEALQWYSKVLACDQNNVEAISNTAATLLSLNRRKEAESNWLQSVKLRPSYFEAVEHLVGLLCGDQRGREAVKIIDFVETSLKLEDDGHGLQYADSSYTGNNYAFDLERFSEDSMSSCHLPTPIGSAISGFNIPASDNGRMVALIHAKGNLLYALGDNLGAAKSFEDAIMVSAGRRPDGIRGLIKYILRVFAAKLDQDDDEDSDSGTCESILLLPEMALKTASLVFPSSGGLPGLRHVPDGQAKRAAISTTSNSLLSLAKIYQDGMSSSGATANGPKTTSGVQDILALYYLSLSLQPSPSTANNVGILLASVQQSAPQRRIANINMPQTPTIPGVVPGSGIALALAYYNYGLNLDSRHAHLYTNLGSLLKDIGQLTAAIKMYEQAVSCDGNFDIALANLANAVKDQGRISDAIGYYKRAVSSNPDFAEAVCGLANALNSVCSWNGRGGIVYRGVKHDRWHVDEQGMLFDANLPYTESSGWIARVVRIVEKQLYDGKSWGKGVLQSVGIEDFLIRCQLSDTVVRHGQSDSTAVSTVLADWSGAHWEGARVVRLVERATKRLGWQLYQDKYVNKKTVSWKGYTRPQLPAALAIPSAPTVLPFHTFTCPLTAKQIRKISQRNGLRISCSTLRAPWLPSQVFNPPSPPNPQLNIGYVSSDFNNHPLAHLMQSVFGFHDPSRAKAYCYATTASDNSVHREQIQHEAPVFHDASSWPVDRLVKQIVDDGIHILINLNGYTRGARNEVFAARPAPIQMSFMGFAGTLGAEWCDYLLADTIAIPPTTLRPFRNNVDVLDQTHDNNHSEEPDDWVYGENIIYTRDTFFCCDHRQSAPDAQEPQLTWADEQKRRRRMRKELFPDLSEEAVILGNFNQLYKIDPTTLRTWLRILMHIPTAVLWLLRFPDLGEANLRATAHTWAGPSVAARLIFTDVAPKHQHISRARICDLFLDTPECNAHTTAADVLWSGTPLLTYPRYAYKMCSRMAASILRGALPRGERGEGMWRELVVASDAEYEDRAVELVRGLVEAGERGLAWEGGERGLAWEGGEGCRLLELRRALYEGRWESALFDTRRWVRDLEEAYGIAWERWVQGRGGDIVLER